MNHLPTWHQFDTLQNYEETVQNMETCVQNIISGHASEQVWCLEHPALYSLGTSAQPHDLLNPLNLPTFKTGRGGKITYHGPGQYIFYVMINLKNHNLFVKNYVCLLEKWIITLLYTLGVTATKHPEHIGIWIKEPHIFLQEAPQNPPSLYHETFDTQARYNKIAAIGVRIRRHVTYHGIALNVSPQMEHFNGIIPCGISDPHLGVTSLQQIGLTPSRQTVIDLAQKTFNDVLHNHCDLDKES